MERTRLAAVVLAGVALVAPASAQPPVPPLVRAVQSGVNVSLSWQAVAGATGYHVFRTADLSQPFQEIGQTANVFLDDPGAVPGPPDRYYYHVRSENVDGLGSPSNLAFRFNLTLDCSVDGCSISVPYLFYPNGVIGAVQTSKDLCQLNPAITSVARFKDNGNGCRIGYNQSCPSGNPTPIFDLDNSAGEGLRIRSKSGSPPFVLTLIGSHDPAFEPGGPSAVSIPACATCTSAVQDLVSIPYHAQVTRASALCSELSLAGEPIVAVSDLFTVAPRRPLHFCGTSTGDFDLVPGNAYWLRVKSTRQWQPKLR